MRGQPKDRVVVGVMDDYLVTIVDGVNCLNPYFASLSVFLENGIGSGSNRSLNDAVVGHCCCASKDCSVDEGAVTSLYAIRAVDAFVNAVHGGLIRDYVAIVLEDPFRGKLVVGMEEEVVGFSAR